MRNYRRHIETGQTDENGTEIKTHVNQTEDRSLWDLRRELKDQERNRPIETRQLVLCKRCCSALIRGRYPLKRIDSCCPRIVRSCEMCRTRTRCGTYEAGLERYDKNLEKYVSFREEIMHG